MITELSYHSPLGKSHHQSFTHLLNKQSASNKLPNEQTTTKYILIKGDYTNIREYFANISWNDKIDNTMVVNSTWKVIHKELLYTIKTFISTQKHRKINQQSSKL